MINNESDRMLNPEEKDDEVIIKIDGVRNDNSQLYRLEDRQPSVDFVAQPAGSDEDSRL